MRYVVMAVEPLRSAIHDGLIGIARTEVANTRCFTKEWAFHLAAKLFRDMYPEPEAYEWDVDVHYDVYDLKTMKRVYKDEPVFYGPIQQKYNEDGTIEDEFPF